MKFGLIGILVGAIFLAACGGKANVNEPPEIVYGQDVCSRCNMIINEERHAAAYWTVDGEARLFDDTGGMFVYQQETGEEVASYWVHDLQTGDWLRAGRSLLRLRPQPGGHPWALACWPWPTKPRPRSLAYGQNGAMVMNFDGLNGRLADGSLVLGPMGMGMGKNH
jgi:copper chaperone NosL